MRVDRPLSLKCFFKSWILAWVIMIYAPSALFALTGISPLAQGRGLLAATLDIADEVAPAAKIGFASLLGLLLFAVRKAARPTRALALVADAALACLAMLLMLLLLPASWSRGFGIGMTGGRFTADANAIYLASAGLAGLAFGLSEAACIRRGKPA